MGPKPRRVVSPPEDDMEEIKKSLEFLSAEIATIADQQKKIVDLMGDIQSLKRLNTEKDKAIKVLECRLANLEQYSRMNNVIVSGLKTKHRSYASVAARENGPVGREGVQSESEVESLEQQVVSFLGSRRISVDRSDIEACHTLPTRTKGATPAIIIRFTNRKNKIAILKQGRKLKGTEVYEHLTKRNGEIARRARILRKQSKIQSTWTASCKVFIKLNGTTPEEEKVMVINDISDLDKFDI
ncbi:uncharacterized protein [Nerophis lumbriciformis]|uniref:uncharacterized protein n=1 Tax=Nerophis lumbriciformis TaxID=546530 RepID=UPI002AE0572A|nr:uncharacterized protein LOC133619520 [Nerophis lumbriciformis]